MESKLTEIRRCTHTGRPLGSAEFVQALEGSMKRRLAPRAVRNVFLCPAGKELTLQIITNEENGVRRHVYKAPKAACRTCALRDQCGPKNKRPEWRRAVTRNEEPPASIAFKAKMETETAQQIYR